MLYNCIFNNRDQLIVSSSLRQSKRVMYFVEGFFRAMQKLPSLKGLKYVVDNNSEKRFNLNNKSIMCLPASPETVRSFAGDVLLDEFAMYKEDRNVYNAIFPSITRGYNITINSTPLGNNNMFYEIWNNSNKYKNYSRYKIDIYEAIKQGLKVDIEELKNNIDEDGFRQEYMCEFIDENTSIFTYDLLKNCIDDYSVSDGKCYMGVDIGRKHDRTCISVVKECNNIFYLETLEVLKNKKFDEQKEVILRMIRQYEPQSILIDRTGLGMQLAEELETDIINCKGVDFTAGFKNDIITNCKKLMEQGKFKMYDERELITDFHSIRKTVSSANNIIYEIEKNESGHGDRAVSVILSLFAPKYQCEPKMYFV
jgi:phage FluMu gp28-like protein